MNASIELLGFGVAAVDDVLTAAVMPAPNTKGLLLDSQRLGGGQTATAMVAASRLGCACGYWGHLGADDRSEFVRDVFRREHIAFRDTVDHPEASPTYAVIIVETSTGRRSILWTQDKVVPPRIGEAERRRIAEAKCLLVDQNFPECHIAAAKEARRRGVPVVGDLEKAGDPVADELVALADHLIIPLEMPRNYMGATTPADAVAKLMQAPGRQLACVTDGENGCWYASADAPGKLIHQPAFVMPSVVDTNGCGDVFHGAYAAALVKGMPTGERIHRAAAAAALKTQKVGGQTGAPTLDELETFLRQAGASRLPAEV